MTDSVSFTIVVAQDGGLVVYSAQQDMEQGLVFAGNQKDTCDYLSKRVSELKAEKSVEKTIRSVYSGQKYDLRDLALDDDRITELRRTGAIS